MNKKFEKDSRVNKYTKGKSGKDNLSNGLE